MPLSRKNVVFLKLMCYNIKYIDRCSDFLTIDFDLSSLQTKFYSRTRTYFHYKQSAAQAERGANRPWGLPHKNVIYRAQKIHFLRDDKFIFTTIKAQRKWSAARIARGGFPAIKELFNMKGFGAVFLALVSAAAGAAAAVYAMKKHEELEQYDYDYDDDDEMYFGDDCDDDCDDCSCSSCTSETPEELDKLDSDEPAAAPAPEAEDEADSNEDFKF